MQVILSWSAWKICRKAIMRKKNEWKRLHFADSAIRKCPTKREPTRICWCGATGGIRSRPAREKRSLETISCEQNISGSIIFPSLSAINNSLRPAMFAFSFLNQFDELVEQIHIVLNVPICCRMVVVMQRAVFNQFDHHKFIRTINSPMKSPSIRMLFIVIDRTRRLLPPHSSSCLLRF